MAAQKIRWGVIGTAKIGTLKVIPAMQAGAYCEVSAIASRNIATAEQAASDLNIPKAYGSYDELLSDPEIDAVYIPLPNHLHVDWAIRSLTAGKHVLCEKPLGLSAENVRRLIAVSEEFPRLKIMEAFMYRFHPQWQFAKKLVDDGEIGAVGAIQAFFSYFNVDPGNIRNKPEAGGGGLMDIGCYCVSQSRFILDREPSRVFGNVMIDQELGTDRLSTGILEFPGAVSSFTCSTQLFPYQRINLIGTNGRIEVEIPVNALPEAKSRLWLHNQQGSEEILFEPCNQYTLQGDAFSRCVLDNTPVPFPLTDALKNMRVIEAVFESGKKNGWMTINEQ